MLKRLAPLLVATALLAGGCAAETIPDSEKILIESSSSPLGPAAGDGKAKNRGAKAKKKPANVVIAREAGVRFTAPRGWSRLGEGGLSYAADSPRGQEMAQRLGMTMEQFKAMVESTDAFLVGLSGNLSVTRLPGYSSIPTAGDVRSQLSTVAEVSDVTDVNTALGTGRRARYAITSSVGTQYGTALMVASGGGVAQLTVTSASAAASDDVMATVVKTLKRA
ncbi:MAG: hypothetical protein NTX33_13300 [Propionibacteriales bacterium]|nr:hypothetical protein [Propionibacteriales bacterium]